MSLAKRNDLQLYDTERVQTQEQNVPQVVSKVNPVSKRKNITSVEKIIFFAAVAGVFALSVLNIRLTTAINNEEQLITEVQQQIKVMNKELEQLEQDKQELMSAERIKQIAEKFEIAYHSENIRVIK